MSMKIIDLHCDTISRIYQERKQGMNLRNNPFQVDLMKMKTSGYLLQNFAIFIDLGETANPYETFQRHLKVFQEEMRKNSDLIAPAATYSDILANEAQGRMSALLTLEEGEVCQCRIDTLHELYRLGIRMMTFTWNYPNCLGFPGEPAPFANLKYIPANWRRTAGYSRKEKGLTRRGIEILEEMEHLGIIPDVSHLSEEGIRDVCRFAKKPFCASHSNARSLCHRGRNLPDGLIRGIAQHGGIIGVNYYGPFLSDTPDTQGHYMSRVKDIALHIQHIADKGGISCIGLGSDFDGIDNHLELKDCSKMELLERELKNCGFHESEIEQIFYKNVLSFYQEVL